VNLHCCRKILALMLLAFTITGAKALAQVPTGNILGVVIDEQGLAVADATITLTNQGTSTSLSGKTSSLGGYQFTRINVGVYRIDVSKPGFKSSVVTGIELDASTDHSVPPIVLEVGAVTETITVEAGADLVQTAGAALVATVDKPQIEELPILDRDPLNLLSLQAGVSQNGRSPTAINGQRPSFSSMTLDGINIQDNYLRSNALDYTPNLLLISQTGEFTTTTQNAGPQAGLGSSQVSIVTPSGTNYWHGEGLWYYRTGAWAANDWFNNANGVPKPNLLQNQAGASLGGPIVKDKLFVYGAYELVRLRQQTPVDTTILTGPARSGIFQWRATCTTASCPSGVTPGSIQSLDLLGYTGLSVDPVIASMLARTPTTINNLSIGDGLNTGGYSYNQRSNRSRDNTLIRLDWIPVARHSFAGTYAWNRDLLDRPGASLNGLNTYDAVPSVYDNDKENFLSSSWRWNPASDFTNEVRFGFDLAPISFLTNQNFGAFTVSNTLFNNPDQNVFPSSRKTHTWSWQDNATWVHGNHTYGFGMQVERVTVFAQNFANTVPDLSIGNYYSGHFVQATDFSGGISGADLVTANALLSTLAGIIYQETQTFNVTSRTSGYVTGAPAAQNFRFNDWSLYASDSWKLRRNFTLNYGLRWEYYSPFNERDGLLMLPVVPAGQTVQQTLASDATLNFFGNGTGRQPYQKDLNNFSPNVGFAWDLFGDGKTSIRGGYSINYVNDELIYAPYNATLSNPGVSTQTGNSYLDTTISSPAPPVAVPPFSNTFSGNWINLYNYNTGLNYGYAIDPNLRTPYVQQWNLSVQREITRNTSVTVSYVGNRGSKLYRAIDLNQVVIKPNGFLQAFNIARQNGFQALAAGAGFDPCYNPGGSGCNLNVSYFNNNFLYGSLFQTPGYDSIIAQYIQQGAVGDLADLYHSIGNDSSYLYQYYYGTDAPVPLAANQYLRAADLLGNYSSSTYHAGIIEIRRRFRSGLIFQANYTFSKVLTDYSGDTSDRFSPYLDNANPGQERARATFDLTHAFKGNFMYQLPFGKGQAWAPSNAFLSQLASGWNVSSIITWQSGAPFSILSGRGTLNRSGRSAGTNTAFTTSTPQQIAGQLGAYPQANGQVLLINPMYIGVDGRGVPDDALTCTPLAAGGFCNPAPGTVGNLPRDAFNGPPLFNWDLSILKSFSVTESKRFEYRLDLFNAFNHPTFAVGNPGAGITDMNINDANFGVATSTVSSPRRIQMGLRFVF
jgi:Carboxypeptidase regulatory-like domain/TonB dependent receptor-like, beta-barrel